MTGASNTVVPIDVLLRASWIEGVGYRYDVILGGETIVRRSRDPEHDAARVLHARGLRGRFRTVDALTGRHRMTLDIARAAGLRVVERDDRGPPALVPYRPMSDAEKARVAGHRSGRGRPSGPGLVPDSGDAVPAAGGETCVSLRRIPEDA